MIIICPLLTRTSGNKILVTETINRFSSYFAQCVALFATVSLKAGTCKLFLPDDLPHKELLRAGPRLLRHADAMSEMRRYPGDTARCLDNLVLSRFGFSDNKVRSCHNCLSRLKSNAMPAAALANGVWTGDPPPLLQNISWVERAAASAV